MARREARNPHIFAHLLNIYLQQTGKHSMRVSTAFIGHISKLLGQKKNEDYVELALNFIEKGVLERFGYTIQNGFVSANDYKCGKNVDIMLSNEQLRFKCISGLQQV